MCYTITLNYTITREYSADMLICLTAPYLTDDCQLVANSGCHRLQSADVDTCIIPQTNTRLGDRSFAFASPRLWNTLPVELRQPDVELVTFWWLLKTHLFQ